ncbi:hypothetical protein B0D95_16830 [Cellvibrio sp. PSBB023]|nr:hypothetical protein B0D95_16830 [Cellvibrio sp. PSBB023]
MKPYTYLKIIFTKLPIAASPEQIEGLLLWNYRVESQIAFTLKLHKTQIYAHTNKKSLGK